jgi:hypothetical protein
MKIQGCYGKINVTHEVDKDCTVITFANLHDMLDFCGHQVYLLGEDLFCKIGMQYVTFQTCYAYQFKTVDFEKHIQKQC